MVISMNKYERAYKYIDNLLDISGDKNYPLVAEYSQLLKEVVDKETPKIKRKPRYGMNMGATHKDYYCDRCEQLICMEPTKEMFEEHYNYCPNCGQKLDWSK